MNKRRLLALADFLETKVPRKNFDFGAISSGDVDRLTPSCGSTGCAMGWAPSMRCFKREGWKLSRWDGEYDLVRSNGEHLFYIDAAMEMFGLSEDESHYLFTPGDFAGNEGRLDVTATPKQVAKRIRQFVARKENELGKR